MTRQELKERITNRLDFCGTVMEAMKEAPDMEWENYLVRILTIFQLEDPMATLSYEKKGNRLKLWFLTDPETKNGKFGYLEGDTFEENLNMACDMLQDVIELCEEAKERFPDDFNENPAYTIKWVGEE